jgi:integrase
MAGKTSHRGFGYLRKLPSKRWQASYVGPDLARHYAPSTYATRDKSSAEAWLAAERRLIAEGTWTPPARRGAPTDVLTFGDYAREWLATRQTGRPARPLKPRTRDSYQRLLDAHVLPTFGDVAVGEVTQPMVRAWYAKLDPSTPTLRAHAYSLLKTVLASAVDDDDVPLAVNPCRVRGAGTTKRARKVKPATLDELAALADAMPAKYRAMVLLAAWCALRIGELTELRRRDIDVAKGVIHVTRGVVWVDSRPVVDTPKSEAGERDVAIPPHLLPLLKAHLAEHAQWGRDGLLFPSRQGIQLTTSTVYASWWPARRKAGRADLRFHDLRHTGATLAAATGATLAELMARLGHSTPAAAMIYQHAAKARDVEIAALLSKLAVTSATGTTQ